MTQQVVYGINLGILYVEIIKEDETMKRDYKSYPRKRIDYDDDFVVVYDDSGNQIYKGIEDYEPMKDENWAWDNSEQIYRCNGYIKVCLEV